jgi:hypothetical protein
MTAEVLYFAGSRDHKPGWLAALLSVTERGPLEGDPDNSVIALYCIDYQRGAHTVCRCILFKTSRCLGAPGQLGAPSNCLVCLPSRDGPGYSPLDRLVD